MLFDGLVAFKANPLKLRPPLIRNPSSNLSTFLFYASQTASFASILAFEISPFFIYEPPDPLLKFLSPTVTMKPLVSAMNAWTWFAPVLFVNPQDTNYLGSIVISVFAIVILSVLGALFKVSRYCGPRSSQVATSASSCDNLQSVVSCTSRGGRLWKLAQ